MLEAEGVRSGFSSSGPDQDMVLGQMLLDETLSRMNLSHFCFSHTIQNSSWRPIFVDRFQSDWILSAGFFLPLAHCIVGGYHIRGFELLEVA